MANLELAIGERALDLRRARIMGVVNVSPESFSDGGTVRSTDEHVAHAERLLDEGADVIDIGGQSLSGSARELSPEEEIDRVIPVVAALVRSRPATVISVDTYKPAVAIAAIAAGASIVNDVSGVVDPDIVAACVEGQAALVISHTRVEAKSSQKAFVAYDDVVEDVVRFLADRLEHCAALGLPAEATILDPGVDLSKTPADTINLLRGLDRVRALGRPVLLALSRKDFLGAIVERPPRERDAATMAAIALVGSEPGDIVRVHSVPAARDAFLVAEVLDGRRVVPADYRLADHLRRSGS